VIDRVQHPQWRALSELLGHVCACGDIYTLEATVIASISLDDGRASHEGGGHSHEYRIFKAVTTVLPADHSGHVGRGRTNLTFFGLIRVEKSKKILETQFMSPTSSAIIEDVKRMRETSSALIAYQSRS